MPCVRKLRKRVVSPIANMNIANFLQMRRNAAAMLVLFFCLSFAAIIAQTWWAIMQDKEITLAAEKGSGLVAVRILQEHATQTLQEAERKILTVVQAVHASNSALQQEEILLQSFVNAKILDHGAVKTLQYINRDGIAWVSSLDFPSHANDVSRRWEVQFLLQRPDFQESVIGHAFQSRYDSQWVMPVVRNLYDKHGNWLGLISADVRVNYFAAVYARAAKDNDATVSLFANQGFVIVRSPFEARYADRDISHSPVLKLFAGDEMEGSFTHADFLDDEKARLYTYRKVTGFPITTVYGRDLQAILAPWRQRSRDRILFSTATIASLGLLTFYLRWHIRRLRHSRQSLRETENKFISLFVQSPLPLALVDLSNDQFVEVNQVFLQQFGYVRTELVGKTPLDVRLWQQPLDRKNYLETLQRQRFVNKLEVQFLRKNGEPLTCLLSSRLLDEIGQNRVIFSPLDVTRQRQIETEIRELNQQLEARVRSRTQRLEQTNQDLADTLQSLKDTQKELIQAGKMAGLGSLVAGVAHEIHAPIGNSMQMANDMADAIQNLQQIMRERSIRRSELMRFLSDGAETAATLLGNLVRAAELVSSFKQVAVDQASNQARHFDVRRVLEEIVLTSAPLYRDLALEMQLDLQSDIVIHSFPGVVSQAISHFLSNALLHAFVGRTSGKMFLSCRMVQEQQVEIVFGDDGIGIAKADLARVFEPFFTSRAGGNGLGMHIVYNLVTGVLGGTISLHSEVGQGTQVRLLLPLVAPGLPGNASLSSGMTTLDF